MPSARELQLPRMLETLAELKLLGCSTIDVTGGEPLLRADWDQLCRAATDQGLDVALVTNGTLFDDQALERALAARVTVVSVSVDGLKPTHDATRRFAFASGSAFDAAVRAISRLRGHIPVSVITQVNRTNLNELAPLGRFLGELGVVRWQLQLAIPIPKLTTRTTPYCISPDQIAAVTQFIVDSAKRPDIPLIHTSDNIGYGTPAEIVLRRKASGPGLWLGCVAGIRSLAIKYDGTVRGCSLLPSDFNVGNLHDESITEIWSDPNRFAFSAGFEPNQLCGGCKQCEHGTLCRAGCTTMAYFSTGTTGDNPYCLRRVQKERK